MRSEALGLSCRLRRLPCPITVYISVSVHRRVVENKMGVWAMFGLCGVSRWNRERTFFALSESSEASMVMYFSPLTLTPLAITDLGSLLSVNEAAMALISAAVSCCCQLLCLLVSAPLLFGVDTARRDVVLLHVRRNRGTRPR